MANRLARSASPYLRQHADNPVDWHEWGEDAFAEARLTDRPILLSVGYSACHWCHVMAHESFENEEVARSLNSKFVNVKVDREERPDVDALYMDAVQALTGRGGWPMTVFCTPTGEPFYGGTYFPRDTFLALAAAVDDAWKNRRDELRQNVEALVELVGRSGRLRPDEQFQPSTLRRTTLDALRDSFDAEWGGFGAAPKFPSTFALDLCLHEHLESREDELSSLVRTSLDAMAAGGIHDHIGGGFARYSVDRQWLVPHFEKMLYDQALLLRTYVHAAVALREPRYEAVARGIVQYVLRDMQNPEGGFHSAEDADSVDSSGHSHEGAFYTWTPDEVRAALPGAADEAIAWWGITEAGNFEGRSILHRIHDRENWRHSAVIEESRRRLFDVREKRMRPGRDDKVLTEWNAMMLSSLCEAATHWGEPEWISAALSCGEFLRRNLRRADGGWHRSWQVDATPRARHEATAHDVAHVVDAFTRLYELTGDETWLAEAVTTADHLLDEFGDHENGGLFTVGRSGEKLLARQKDLMDNATPSANSVAAAALLRLSAHVAEPRYREFACGILALLAAVIPQAPSAFCNALAAMHLWDQGIDEIVIPGKKGNFLEVVRRTWRPHCIVAWGSPTFSPLWQSRAEGMAYVCRDGVCSLPASTPEELESRLVTIAPGE